MLPPTPKNDFESLASGTIDALNTIATNTNVNTNQISSLLSTIQAQQDEINQLKANVNNVSTPKTDNTSGHNKLLETLLHSVATHQNDSMDKLIEMMKSIKKDNNNNNQPRTIYYCWSCGFGTNPNHTSATCTRKREGHIATATKDNRQGGCLRNAKRLRVKLNN